MNLPNWAFLIAGVLTGIILESGQLLTALYAGYTFRFVDIDDVIFNISGTLLGYFILFKLFKLTFHILVRKWHIKFNSIVKHISIIHNNDLSCEKRHFKSLSD